MSQAGAEKESAPRKESDPKTESAVPSARALRTQYDTRYEWHEAQWEGFEKL